MSSLLVPGRVGHLPLLSHVFALRRPQLVHQTSRLRGGDIVGPCPAPRSPTNIVLDNVYGAMRSRYAASKLFGRMIPRPDYVSFTASALLTPAGDACRGSASTDAPESHTSAKGDLAPGAVPNHGRCTSVVECLVGGAPTLTVDIGRRESEK